MIAGLFPPLDAAVEDRHVAVPEPIEHPPQPGRIGTTLRVVDDHHIVGPDAAIAEDPRGSDLEWLGDVPLVDDCVQEAFLKAFLKIDGFEARSSLKTWLHRITVNVCHDARRRKTARRADTTTSIDEQTVTLVEESADAAAEAAEDTSD